METPREKIKKLQELNGAEGFYGTHYQFIILIENNLRKKTINIMKSLNQGTLWINERVVYNKIYNHLLDGFSTVKIKSIMK